MKSVNYNMDKPADNAGIALSILCLFHCLALPLIFAALPMIVQSPTLGWLHENEWVHIGLLVPILVISGPVLLRGAQSDKRIGILGGIGIAALCIALVAPGERMEQAITTLGTIMIIGAHILNIRRRP